MIENLTIIQTDDLQKRLGNQFLKQHKQTLAGQEDDLFIVKNAEQIIIGAARLEKIEETLWLRNVYIEENYRNHGLGTLLIRSMQYVMSQQETVCFAVETLQKFYQGAGFINITADQLNPTLHTKYLSYLNKTPSLHPFRLQS